jgi:SAM-dependent methyltransferase
MRDKILEKSAARGEPSYVWRSGQERRLRMILDAVGPRIEGNVLDIGCGLGLYLERLSRGGGSAFGTEFDFERAQLTSSRGLKVVSAAGEALPFPDSTFDIILSHEVLEHVIDDRASTQEMVRLLRRPDAKEGLPAGRLVLFVPNRGYPFETHGIFWRGKYIFGNIPLINYFPLRIRNRLAPHVRVYRKRDLQELFRQLPVRIIKRTVVFGAYDNIITKWPTVGRVMRSLLQGLERTPFRTFGLSHFWVLERL